MNVKHIHTAAGVMSSLYRIAFMGVLLLRLAKRRDQTYRQDRTLH